MALAVGTKLGPYEIVALIGAGGMGEVYKARDTRLNRTVAIKQSKEQFSERFEREARAIAALNHPNICQVYDVGPNYLVMEFVEGEPLKGPLPLDETLRIAGQIADALQAAHEKDIVHRDLKPGNILLKPDGLVKVLDFGLAKVGAGPAASSGDAENSPTLSMAATRTGVILGTAAYMSPEQARGRAATARADIWAFGVVLYETITGSRLFQGEDLTDTLASILKEQPDLSAAPYEVRRVLEACLQKDPKHRLQAIGDWKLLIEKAEPATAQVAPPPHPKSSKLPWAIAAAGVLAALGISFVQFRETPPSAPHPSRFTIPLPQKATFTDTGGMSLSPDGRTLVFAALGSDRIAHLWARPLDSLDAHPLPETDGIDTVITNSVTLAWSPDSRSLVYSVNNTLKRLDLAGGPAQTLCECAAVGAAWNADGVILIGSARGIERIPSAGGTPTPVTVTSGEGRYRYPVFLPDGRHFLYFRNFQDASRSGIFLGDLNAKPEGQSSQRLLATEYTFAYAPTSKPGQGRILFLRGGTLMVQNWDISHNFVTGDPVPAADHISFSAAPIFYSRMTVSANGTLVYRTGSSADSQLTWLDRDGKTISTIGPPDRYNVTVLSPDGTKAVVNRTDGSGKSDFWTVDLAHGTSTRLTSDPGIPGNPIVSPDGSSVIYGSLRNQTIGLYRKPITGSGAEEVILSPANSSNVTDWSRDGRFVLYFAATRGTGNDLWVLPLEGDRKPFPYLRTPYAELAPRLSPDGRWIVYLSNETGKREVYVKKFIPEPDAGASAAAGKWLVSRNGGVGMVHWRKDGKELYYLSADSKMMAVDVTTTPTFQSGTPKALFPVPEAFMRQSGTPGNLADISPDGKRFLFALPVEQNQPDVLKVVLNWESTLKN